MSDTEALTRYVESLGIYDKFRTMTMDRAHEFGVQDAEAAAAQAGTGKVGRPTVPDSKVELDGTAASKDSGSNTKEGRETAAAKCPLCHEHDLLEGQRICEECLESLLEEQGE